MIGSTQDLVILKLDHAKQALAEAKTIQQTKTILDIAGAWETLAKRQQLGDDAIAYAHEIKVEALRQLGGLLRATPRNEGTRLAGRAIGGSARELPKDPTPTLADLGIDKKTSMIAQQLADLPADQFKQVAAGTATVAMVLRASRGGANTTPVAWSLESVDHGLRDVINKLIKHAPPGSQHEIAELFRRFAAEIDEADRPELRESVSIARDELDVHDAEPGAYRIFESAEQASTHSGSPTVIGSCKSTYPAWYQHLTTAQPGITALRRKQVDARFADIDAGTLPTKRTARTYWAVVWAIRTLPWTSPLSRGGVT